MERRVQELKKVLRALMLRKQATTWDVYLQQTLHTFRNRQNPQPNTDMKFQEQGNGKSPRIRRNGYTKNGKNARESQTTTNILSAKIRTWQTRAENRVKMEGNGVMARVCTEKRSIWTCMGRNIHPKRLGDTSTIWRSTGTRETIRDHGCRSTTRPDIASPRLASQDTSDQGQHHTALVDSGAAINVISKGLCQQTNLTTSPQPYQLACETTIVPAVGDKRKDTDRRTNTWRPVHRVPRSPRRGRTATTVPTTPAHDGFRSPVYTHWDRNTADHLLGHPPRRSQDTPRKFT